MRIGGKVVSGMGQGSKFFLLAGYRLGFTKLLGVEPFAGTLNIDIGRENASKMQRVLDCAELKVSGFEQNGRRYYDVRCVRADVCGVEGLLIFPHLNHHPPNILEFVCAQNLREKYELTNGKRVDLNIYVED